jgi:hypothetical protein
MNRQPWLSDHYRVGGNISLEVSMTTHVTKTGPEERRRTRFVAALVNPDFLAVVAFCLIGLLVTLNLILRYADFGAVIEQYNQF